MRKAFVWFSGFRALATSPTDIEHELVVIRGIIKRRDIDLSPPVGEWPLFAHSGRQVAAVEVAVRGFRLFPMKVIEPSQECVFKRSKKNRGWRNAMN